MRWSSTNDSGELDLRADEPATVSVVGDTVTIELTEPVGISELDFGVHRVVAVEDTADAYFFQRLLPETPVLRRSFTVEEGTWTLSTAALIDGSPHPPGPLTLSSGEHTLVTKAETVSLTRGDMPAASWAPLSGDIAAAGHERVIMTARSFNSGLRGSVDGVELAPLRIDSGMQGFVVPAGVSGQFTMTFAGSSFFRNSLIFGGVLSLLALAACLWIDSRRPRCAEAVSWPVTWAATWPVTWAATLITAVAAAGWVGLGAWVAVLLIRRFTLIPGWALGAGAIGFMGLWLARAPWPAANYAGDSVLVAAAGCVAVASLAASVSTPARHGTSRSAEDNRHQTDP